MENFLEEELIKYLKKFVTKKRLNTFQKKIDLRSNHLTLVLEDVFQSRNISAAIRSADCFGLQKVHIIENKNKYITDKTVSLGASKWLNIVHHNQKEKNTEDCIRKLKTQGYQIIAATPNNHDITLEDIDIKNNKVAILLGTELTGLSEEALSLSDKKMKIEMYGFTESLNISVSAAICCQKLSSKLRKERSDWRLNEEEKNTLLLNCLRNTIKSSKQIEQKFMREK